MNYYISKDDSNLLLYMIFFYFIIINGIIHLYLIIQTIYEFVNNDKLKNDKLKNDKILQYYLITIIINILFLLGIYFKEYKMTNIYLNDYQKYVHYIQNSN